MSRSESIQTAITIAFSFVLPIPVVVVVKSTDDAENPIIPCWRCGKSAFYFHGLINKQKSKEFACFRQDLVLLHQAINKSFCEILKYYLSGRDLNVYQI